MPESWILTDNDVLRLDLFPDGTYQVKMHRTLEVFFLYFGVIV